MRVDPPYLLFRDISRSPWTRYDFHPIVYNTLNRGSYQILNNNLISHCLFGPAMYGLTNIPELFSVDGVETSDVNFWLTYLNLEIRFKS